MKAHYRPKQEKRSPDKHATPWHKAVAEAGTILRLEVGSGLHGTSISNYDDRDEMGICVEPESAVIGFRQFEQYEWKTAWERTGGRDNRSGDGDLDLTVYSLRKWMRLAANGNPTVLLPFFAPEDKIVSITGEGSQLRERMPQYVLSRSAGDRFAGYLRTQRAAMLSHDGKGHDCTRPELIEKYGFDTKFAGHMIRLGLQGIELMQTGKITLPMPWEDQERIKNIRTGEYSMKVCLDWAEQLEHDLARVTAGSHLRPSPDWDVIDRWLIDIYQEVWLRQEITAWLESKPEPY